MPIYPEYGGGQEGRWARQEHWAKKRALRQLEQPQQAATPEPYNPSQPAEYPASSGSGSDGFIVGAVIGALIALALQRSPGLRMVAAVVLAALGIYVAVVGGSDGVSVGLCFFTCAAALFFWAKHTLRTAEAQQQRAADNRTPESIARLLTGSPVTYGPCTGYVISSAAVDARTVREYQGTVWAEADAILSSGLEQRILVSTDGVNVTWRGL